MQSQVPQERSRVIHARVWLAGLVLPVCCAPCLPPAKAQQPPAGRTEEPKKKEAGGNLPQAPKKASATTPLLKARLDAAQQNYRANMEAFGNVRSTGNVAVLIVRPETVYTWSVRWLNAQRDLSDHNEKHLAALQEHFNRMRELPKKMDQMPRDLLPQVEAAAASWYLAEAALWLAQAKAK